MPAPNAYNYVEPSWVQDFLVADSAKKLSSADRKDITKKRNAVAYTQEELAQNIAMELNPSNMTQLASAMKSTDDLEILKILGDEKDNLMAMIAASGAKPNTPPQEVKASLLDTILNSIQNLWSTK
jgi:hypothetical protein